MNKIPYRNLKPMEGTLPSTMTALFKEIGFFEKPVSTFDFGIYAVQKSKQPSIMAAKRAYKYLVLLAIGRALVARHYGFEYSAEQVKESIRQDFSGKSIFKTYADLVRKSDDSKLKEELNAYLSIVDKILSENIMSNCEYLKENFGQKWSITPYIKYVHNQFRLSFPKIKPAKKNGPKR